LGEASADEAEFGGTTDESYRRATADRNVNAVFAEEVTESQEEQETAEARWGDE
jgi:ring-1,2-phenylacetyl-CoA epoxidase subunit PaaB